MLSSKCIELEDTFIRHISGIIFGKLKLLNVETGMECNYVENPRHFWRYFKISTTKYSFTLKWNGKLVLRWTGT